MSVPEVIYLQCEEDDLPYSGEDTTWCTDKINEHDVKYVRATTLVDAAPDLLKVAKRARDLLVPEVVREPDRTIFWELVDVINKAEAQS
jgi:hypothetical protein